MVSTILTKFRISFDRDSSSVQNSHFRNQLFTGAHLWKNGKDTVVDDAATRVPLFGRGGPVWFGGSVAPLSVFIRPYSVFE